LDQTQHVFSLSGRPGIGVNCGEQGFFVGDVPLVERKRGSGSWEPRASEELSIELSKCYGLDVEVGPVRRSPLPSSAGAEEPLSRPAGV
jgi:hypothetical protein